MDIIYEYRLYAFSEELNDWSYTGVYDTNIKRLKDIAEEHKKNGQFKFGKIVMMTIQSEDWCFV